MRALLRFLAAPVLLLVLCGWLPARAEVGVVRVGANESRGPYILGIIEDPDPVGKVWRQFSAPGSSRVALNPEGELNGDGPPSIVYNAFSKLPIVAWARRSATDFDVVVSHFADGAWSPPTVIAGSPAHEMDPSVTVDAADGSVHVVYWVFDGAPRVLHREAPADLSSWSPPTAVSPANEVAARPAAAFHEGVLRVVYEAHDQVLGGTPRLVVLATRTDGGFSTEVVASTAHPEANWPQVHSRPGRIWIEWIDGPDTMAWRWRDSGQAWAPVNQESFGGSEDRDWFVRGRVRSAALE